MENARPKRLFASLSTSKILLAGALLSMALAATALSLAVAPPYAAADNTATISISVEGYEGELPTLVSGEDFALGEAVQANPCNFVDSEGNMPLAALVAEQEAQGKTLAWYDADTGEPFDWYTTIVERSYNVVGKWEDLVCEVRIVYNDDATEEQVVSVPWGQSFSSVAEVPSDPSKSGWSFNGWVVKQADGTESSFDFDAPVTSSMTVEASWSIADVTVVPVSDPAEDVPKTVTGSCYIGDSWMIGSQSYFTVSGFDGYLSGVSGTGECGIHRAAEPNHVTASYRATLRSVDVESGTVVYDVVVTPPGVSDGVTPGRIGLRGYQTVLFTATLHKNFGGKIALEKSSSNEQISSQNSCYSLAGAKYYITNSKGQVVDVLTTDEDGSTGESKLLPVGTYAITEAQAATGYALNEQSFAATVTAGATTTVATEDAPQYDATSLLLAKVDAESGQALPLGAGTLSGAQFTCEFYGGAYDSVKAARASGSPLRTWTFTTDENGQALLDAEHLASGDELYTNSEGQPVLPLGTLVISEAQAPTGYLPTSEEFAVQITSEGTAEAVKTYCAPTFAEQVKRGDLKFVKAASGTMQRLAGVPFAITSVTTGESHTLVTDENGMASTEASWVAHTQNSNGGTADSGIWFGKVPGSDADADSTVASVYGTYTITDANDELGALPYDTYLIEEQRCEANEGRDLVSFKITLTRNGVTLDLGTLDDDLSQVALIGKSDATTAEQVAGAELLLERWSDEADDWLEYASTVTDNEEWRVEAPTGTYRLTETLAPEGYLTADSVEFEVLDGVVATQVEMVDELAPEEASEDGPLGSTPKTGIAALPVLAFAALAFGSVALLTRLRR